MLLTFEDPPHNIKVSSDLSVISNIFVSSCDISLLIYFTLGWVEGKSRYIYE